MSRLKRVQTFFVYFLSLVFVLGFSIQPAFGIPINSESDFLLINDNLAGDYEITAPISLSPAINLTYIFRGEFSGTLNGNGFTIDGLTKPLFNEISSNHSEDLAIIKNLNLIAAFEGISGRGVLANDIYSNTKIENVRVEGEIKSDEYGNYNVGGLAGTVALGSSSNSTIIDSSASVLVNGVGRLGGLVGVLGSEGSISKSYANGGVVGSSESGGFVGGLVGRNFGSISESYANGSVSGWIYVGGLIGSFDGYGDRSITNSYSSSPVTGLENIGGLVGIFFDGMIRNSFSLGNVTGNNKIGGLVGETWVKNETSDSIPNGIYNSIATGDVSGESNVGQLYGLNSTWFPEAVSDLNSLGYGSKTIAGVETDPRISGAPAILSIINTIHGSYGNSFEQNICFNKQLPYLSDLRYTYSNSCDAISDGSFSRSSLSAILPIERVARLNINNGFLPIKSSETQVFISFLPVDDLNSFTEVSGINTSVDQTSKAFLRIDEGLQISLISNDRKPLQLWVKSPSGDFILFGIITFDENGKSVLPAIEFKNSGQFDFLFINSDNSLDQPDLRNKVGGLTITVN